MSQLSNAVDAACNANSPVVSAPVDALEFVRESPLSEDALRTRRGDRSNRDWRLDVRVGRVAGQREIFVIPIEQVALRRIEFELRQRFGRALDLKARLFEMIRVEMDVAEGVDELARI